MTDMVKRTYEEIDEDLKSDASMAKSAEKPEKLKILVELSHPDNRQNANDGVQTTPLIHENVTNSQPCTSTPKYPARINLHENSSEGKSLRSCMVDSGFHSYNESSSLNSSYNVLSTNSSINQSFNNSYSEGIAKLETPKRNDSFIRSSKSRKKSPSSLSRNRLKVQANNRTKAQHKDELRNNISVISVTGKNDKLGKTTPNCTPDEVNTSHRFSGSSSKTLNQSGNDPANESYNSLVTECSRVTLSNPSNYSCKPSPKEGHFNWQERVDMISFEKTIKPLRPLPGAYLIGSKVALDKFDIVTSFFDQNLFHLTSKLLSHLSNKDLMSFHQVSSSWRRTLQWHSDVNDRRVEHVQSMHNFYQLNKENIVRRSRFSLPLTTSQQSPLQVIQKLSQDTTKQPSPVDRHGLFQQAASELLSHQSLMKCPLCSWASRVDGIKALCMKASCGLQFCSKCLRSDHAFGVICPQEATH